MMAMIMTLVTTRMIMINYDVNDGDDYDNGDNMDDYD